MEEIREIIYTSTAISSLLAVVIPFILPYLWQLIGKWIKREVSSDEKRLVIIGISVIISVVSSFVIWLMNGGSGFKEFIQVVIVGFTSFRGIVQFVYETIIKHIEDRKEEKTKKEKRKEKIVKRRGGILKKYLLFLNLIFMI